MGRTTLSTLRTTSRLLFFGSSSFWLHLGCDDSNPADGSTSASGGSAGSDANALAAATSIGANGGSGGTEADGGSGGSGGSSGSSTGTGGSTASDGGASSVGGSAGAAEPLDGDPRCAGQPLGSACLGHFITTCEDTDDDRWVDFEQTNCAPGVCDDEEEPSCQASKAGESCADAIVVSATGFVLRGLDFATDFEGDLDLSDQSCFYGDPDSSDAVFEVALEAGETLSVAQTGKLPAVLALQTTCGGDQACSESDDSAGGLTLEYTASAAETVFVVLDAAEVAPTVADYALHIDIDRTCGNAIFEGSEDCDDGNTEDGDGCSAACTAEFPHECTESSPSLCQEPRSLGTLDADADVEHVEDSAFGEDERLVLTFTLSERSLLDITATSRTANTGDINFRLYSDWDTVVIRGIQTGNEEYLGEPFEPGTYAIELWAAADLPDGFTFEITSHPVVCGDSVVATGFEECDNGGNEGCADCTVEFGWDCGVASPSECAPVPRIGSTFGAGDPIEDELVETAVAGYSSEYWMIEFIDDVELSGTAVSPEAPNLWSFETATLRSEDQEEYSEYIYPSGAFGPWSVAPGIYVIELFTYSGLPSGYTLSLSTTEP